MGHKSSKNQLENVIFELDPEKPALDRDEHLAILREQLLPFKYPAQLYFKFLKQYPKRNYKDEKMIGIQDTILAHQNFVDGLQKKINDYCKKAGIVGISVKEVYPV